MHADLQRGLVRRLRRGHDQLIVATHSAEILSEVNPEDVVVVNSSERESKPAPDLAAVQHVINEMGGVHNLQLSRLWNARRVLLVEGEDLLILERFHATLNPGSLPLGVGPSWDIGGWGGFNYAIGSAMALYNSAGDAIRTFCVLDSDYHLDEEVAHRLDQASSKHVDLHIWQRKEIENYLLEPQPLSRLISARSRTGVGPSPTDVAEIIDRFACEHEEDVRLALVDAHSDYHRLGSNRSREASRYASTRLKSHYSSRELRIQRCPGKRVLRQVKRWAKEEYGASFSDVALAEAFGPGDIAVEIAHLIKRMVSV